MSQLENQEFRVNNDQLAEAKSQTHTASIQQLNSLDAVADGEGFASRAVRRGGRKRSPHTGQLHAKVLPHISADISRESLARGVQQGALIEEAWGLYRERHPADYSTKTCQ